MATFVLVHGAMHSGSHWDLLIKELSERGHRSIAPDLPIEDHDAGCAEYAEVVLASMTGLNDEVVLVGHSLGCLTVPLVASRQPMRRVIYLAGPLPVPGKSFAQLSVETPDMIMPSVPSSATDYAEGGELAEQSAEALTNTFYHDCPRELIPWLLQGLRPQATKPIMEITPLEALPEVESSYVVCSNDHAINPDVCRAIARDTLGLEPIEIDSSHSPFASKPAALADIFEALALS
jgi:pimeloyl-ACP methyl ester carboxylesterase